MLKISKALSAGKLENYHKQEFTSPEQSYWSQGQTVQGEWQGQLAEKYGLAGAVTADEFHRLSEGQHPQTGEQLVQHRQSFEYQDANGKTIKSVEHRAGWDATFSAPKSVSLTALVGGDNRVREAHSLAVTTALGELERYTQARLGGNRPAESTGQFIVAKFEHDTSRPVDGYAAPQLHTHAVIFNVTERADGVENGKQARALQPQSLFESQQFATAVYQSELTFRLRELGYEIAPGRSGAPEIKGYSQEYLDASSQRQNQILAHMQQNGLSGYEAAEIAAHATRDKKQIQSPAEVLAAHRKLAAEFGNQPSQVVAAARERGEKKSVEHAPEKTQKAAQEAVTFARERSFEREAVTDERALSAMRYDAAWVKPPTPRFARASNSVWPPASSNSSPGRSTVPRGSSPRRKPSMPRRKYCGRCDRGKAALNRSCPFSRPWRIPPNTRFSTHRNARRRKKC